jgi:hypothetical protein
VLARGDHSPQPSDRRPAPGGGTSRAADHWQIRFDHGHQQRYLPDRQAVLRYVLAIAPQAASQRFEVFAERPPAPTAGGQPVGRSFALVDVIDLSRPGEAERLRAELATLAAEQAGPAEDRP